MNSAKRDEKNPSELKQQEAEESGGREGTRGAPAPTCKQEPAAAVAGLDLDPRPPRPPKMCQEAQLLHPPHSWFPTEPFTTTFRRRLFLCASEHIGFSLHRTEVRPSTQLHALVYDWVSPHRCKHPRHNHDNQGDRHPTALEFVSLVSWVTTSLSEQVHPSNADVHSTGLFTVALSRTARL